MFSTVIRAEKHVTFLLFKGVEGRERNRDGKEIKILVTKTFRMYVSKRKKEKKKTTFTDKGKYGHACIRS